MRIALLRSIVVLASISAFGASARSEPCDRAFLNQLESDKTLTAIQRQKTADDQCVGKGTTAIGTVNDVSSNNIELVTADGLRFDIYLSATNKCGDLVRIQKGQRLSLQGNISKVLIARREYVVREAACVK
jgi:hypothetical protein